MSYGNAKNKIAAAAMQNDFKGLIVTSDTFKNCERQAKRCCQIQRTQNDLQREKHREQMPRTVDTNFSKCNQNYKKKREHEGD